MDSHSDGPSVVQPMISPIWLGVAAVLFTIGVYASNFVACRYSLSHGLSAFDLVALRYLVAGVLLLPSFVRLGVRDLGGVGWIKGIAIAALAGSPYMCLFYGGLQFAPASHGAVLNPGVVPSVVYWGLIWLGLQSFSTAMTLSLALIVFGLMLVTGSSFTTQGDMLLGDAMLLATGISWGLFTLLARVWKLQPMQTATIVSVISLCYLPLYAVFFFSGFDSVTSTHLILQAVFQGAVNSIAAICLITYAVRTLGPQLTSLFSPMIPVITTVLAALLIGEIPTLLQATGVLVVVIGMTSSTLINFRNSPVLLGVPNKRISPPQ